MLCWVALFEMLGPLVPPLLRFALGSSSALATVERESVAGKHR
jgi:hypothetical protein